MAALTPSPELRGDRPLGRGKRRRTRMNHHALTGNRRCCCTPLLYSADACTCEPGCACTRGCIPSVSIGITAQTDLVTLMSLGIFAIFPVVQPESAPQRLRHTGDSPPRPAVEARCTCPRDVTVSLRRLLPPGERAVRQRPAGCTRFVVVVRAADREHIVGTRLRARCITLVGRSVSGLADGITARVSRSVARDGGSVVSWFWTESRTARPMERS